jgi:hypothetical protein
MMKNEQFEKDIEVVPNIFKSLAVVEVNGEKFLKGEIHIVDAKGKEWSKYQIEIKGNDGYPYTFPELFETGNAFPHNADWHVYEEDLSCCIDYPANAKIICKNGMHVSDYIKNYAIPYFANQLFRIREGYYRYGEYSHGIFGKIEYYQSKLKAKNPEELLKMFHFILRDFELPRTAECPFCRKVKFRHCHRDVFRELHFVREYLIEDGTQILSFFQKHPDYILPIS